MHHPECPKTVASHSSSNRPLYLAFFLVIFFSILEATAGWLSGSLALLSDAGHLATDAFALGIAAFAAWYAQQATKPDYSFGKNHAEVIAASINAIAMLIIVVLITFSAIQRLIEPRPVQGGIVSGVSSIAILVNLSIAYLLMRGSKTLNKRAALLHILADLLSSFAALFAGLIIMFTGWYPIDPLLSLFTCILLLLASIQILRECLHIFFRA